MSFARLEIHSFATLTLTDKQFLTRDHSAKAEQIGGVLELPLGEAPVPAVVLVHGSGGAGLREWRWAHDLQQIGLGTFLLDSFTGRGIKQTISDQTQLGNLSMIIDAYRALELLSRHPRIDALRIALLGFSKGGSAAIYGSMRRFQQSWGPLNVDFAAHIAFYARCDIRYIDDEDVSNKPIRVFHGSADDYVPIDSARKYVERLQRAGKDVTLTEYSGVHHAFDNPIYQPIRFRPDTQVPRCRRAEISPGNIVNLDTGLPFTMNDSCVSSGASLGYDARAHSASVQSVQDLLRNLFRLPD